MYVLEGGHWETGTHCPSPENKPPNVSMVGSLETYSEMVNGKWYIKSKHTLDRKEAKSWQMVDAQNVLLTRDALSHSLGLTEKW